uniref:Uncharacterized protein n=1 Tax=Ralstonia solanacearum CFBP2957 TaxID=859656 RepID=D8P371_RALSL|nr:protein of unknown function [Ralstonia solanacearum CFBP2957]
MTGRDPDRRHELVQLSYTLPRLLRLLRRYVLLIVGKPMERSTVHRAVCPGESLTAPTQGARRRSTGAGRRMDRRRR